MTQPRIYQRPMSGWWQRHPAYRRYLLREGTSLFLGAYAAWLVAGLVCLAAGEDAYQAWRGLHAEPVVFALHLAAAGAAAYHAVTWLRLLPWTVPGIRIGQRRLSDRAIVRGGWAISALLSGALITYLVGAGL